MTEQEKISLKAVLTSALHNTTVVKNQIDSLSDDYPMENVSTQLQDVVDAINQELEKL